MYIPPWKEQAAEAKRLLVTTYEQELRDALLNFGLRRGDQPGIFAHVRAATRCRLHRECQGDDDSEWYATMDKVVDYIITEMRAYTP